jgi:hypothetical protein
VAEKRSLFILEARAGRWAVAVKISLRQLREKLENFKVFHAGKALVDETAKGIEK